MRRVQPSAVATPGCPEWLHPMRAEGKTGSTKEETQASHLWETLLRLRLTSFRTDFALFSVARNKSSSSRLHLKKSRSDKVATTATQPPKPDLSTCADSPSPPLRGLLVVSSQRLPAAWNSLTKDEKTESRARTLRGTRAIMFLRQRKSQIDTAEV